MAGKKTETVEIVVNGERRAALAASTIEGLLAALEIAADRVAVERNRALVRREDWNRTTICSGDEIEIVHFVGGG